MSDSGNLPDWTPQASQSWKLTLPCNKEEAEALSGHVAAFDDMDAPPVLMTSEPDPARPDDWQLDAYFEGEPDPATIALIRELVPSARGIEALIEPVEDADWVTISQNWLEPIRAGRFFVHTAAHADAVPAETVAFHIEAGRAFGTGHHETTTGCLLMLDRLAEDGAIFANIADIGTGTGLLAFAARALWPQARIIASDIDPVSIDVSEENAVANGIPTGEGPDHLELIVAPGVEHERLQARAPYDLLIANILAGPLIDLAPSFCAAVAPGGSVILAGLLDHQADAVIAAYADEGLLPADRIDRGDWPTLRLKKQS
ncbi:50S ribosomal protein L11 methyltransferase [Sphingomonas oleivorans]|uniref:Ribosomal protein L11 methyltransferase n=1 Tax=Sphingomonas oleivorans TaxID=1735121 RepID=A0A2T5FXK2_9SPHN|nr:50S ribosomal protein L11 methyltransferase [Sphingomonas oleivorans]PTQ10852.1 50S ribosomal protein L11 methyltransferase [Sphingomonas oleivorans]